MHIPRFTVSANAEHFQAISNIVTKLVLFSDPAHKIRMDKLETLVFEYDFTDLGSAANVITSLQTRLRDNLEAERLTMRNPRILEDQEARASFLQLQAHIFALSEELNLLFDAIKMAQDRLDEHTEEKSALLLHASSTEISWRMLDARQNLLSKLVVASINFHWLSRQDSSTVNHLTIGNLSAFDGSRYALWSEILSKYDEPPNHPLLKVGLAGLHLFHAHLSCSRSVGSSLLPIGPSLLPLEASAFMKFSTYPCIRLSFKLMPKLGSASWNMYGLLARTVKWWRVVLRKRSSRNLLSKSKSVAQHHLTGRRSTLLVVCTRLNESMRTGITWFLPCVNLEPRGLSLISGLRRVPMA